MINIIRIISLWHECSEQQSRQTDNQTRRMHSPLTFKYLLCEWDSRTKRISITTTLCCDVAAAIEPWVNIIWTRTQRCWANNIRDVDVARNLICSNSQVSVFSSLCWLCAFGCAVLLCCALKFCMARVIRTHWICVQDIPHCVALCWCTKRGEFSMCNANPPVHSPRLTDDFRTMGSYFDAAELIAAMGIGCDTKKMLLYIVFRYWYPMQYHPEFNLTNIVYHQSNSWNQTFLLITSRLKVKLNDLTVLIARLYELLTNPDTFSALSIVCLSVSFSLATKNNYMYSMNNFLKRTKLVLHK